jgi:hypothetical protein
MRNRVGIGLVDHDSVTDIFSDIEQTCPEYDQFEAYGMFLVVFEAEVMLGYALPIKIVGSSLSELHS